MLILILIDVQYSQKAVFSFEKGLNYQNHSSSGFLHLVKKSVCVCVGGGGERRWVPPCLIAIWKILLTFFGHNLHGNFVIVVSGPHF